MPLPVYTVILAGGSGTRFWPASRSHLPKQLLAIGPGSGETLIARTVHRIASECPVEHVRIATGQALLEATRRALPELPPFAFLAEPVARNTAACIAWATAKIARQQPDALVMVLPSDHHIGNEPEFLAVVRRALASAETRITTLGLQPLRAETGYGYIESGVELAPGVRQVVRFVEKPNRERAEAYLQSGRYLWNSGMFFFSARALLQAVALHMPQLHAGLQTIELAAQRNSAEEQAVTERVFTALPSVSIDFGIMEKLTDLAVVPGEFGWSDLGSWQTLWELAPKDSAGNSLSTSAVVVDARGNLMVDLRSTNSNEKRVMAALGVDNLCIIETDDALLVVPRDRAQDVRAIVETLKEKSHRCY